VNFCNHIELGGYIENQRKKWIHKLFSQFLIDESSLSDTELVYVYNQVVYANDSVFAGDKFKKILCKEFGSRSISQSNKFANYERFFNEPFLLKGNELLPIIWLNKKEVNKLLIEYLNLTDGYKIWYHATVIEYDDNKIVFGMKKTMGRLSIKVDYLLSSLPPNYKI